MSSFTIPFLHCSGSSIIANAIRHEKEVKGIQIEKEEIQLSLFTDDTIIYVEITRKWTKKLLKLITNYSKLARYKVNIKKS